MLQHGTSAPIALARVVVLGARGFVGSHLLAHMQERAIPTLALGSSDLDLTADDADARLAAMLRADDALVMLSTLTPDRGRGIDIFQKNIAMAASVIAALERAPVAHAVYMSSDAVYAAGNGLIDETTAADPDDLYGVMHKARETAFKQACKSPLAILRSTLIFGPGDTHNSYGPNRFRRIAAQSGQITLGGNGEETRDHLYVRDLCRLIGHVLERRSQGVLNVATGRSRSFNEAALEIAQHFAPAATVAYTPRTSPISHRHFNVTALHKAFPEFIFTPFAAALAETHRLEGLGATP